MKTTRVSWAAMLAVGFFFLPDFSVQAGEPTTTKRQVVVQTQTVKKAKWRFPFRWYGHLPYHVDQVTYREAPATYTGPYGAPIYFPNQTVVYYPRLPKYPNAWGSDTGRGGPAIGSLINR